MKPENKFRKDALTKVAGGTGETIPTEKKDPLKLEAETQKTVAPEDLPKVAGGAGETIPTEEKDPLKLETETQKTVAPEDLPKVAGGTGETTPADENDPLKLANTKTKEDVNNLPPTSGETVAPANLTNVAGGKGPLERVKKELQLEKIDPDSFPITKFRAPKLPPRTKSPLGGHGEKTK